MEPTPIQPIYEKKPTNSRKIILLVLVVILSYKFGYASGKKGYVFEPKSFKVINQNHKTQEVDYQLLWDALSVVDKNYIEKTPGQDKILYGAIRGAVESYGDPYTSFFEPQALTAFKTDLAGSFDGIGAEIGKKDGNIVIVAPLDDMPAEKAGIKAKDILLEVNGEAVTNWTVEQAVGKIRGVRGTKVKLKIYREGKSAPLDFEITRQKIEVKSVKMEIKQVGEKTLAVIKLSRFGDDTEELMNKAVNEILTKGVEGIVLDMRNNPGGYLDTAVSLASHWIEQGKVVVSEARSQGEPEQLFANRDNRLAKVPTVVLINGGSASASEILAGALQDYKIAKLVGEKSFGKGSVQQLIDISGGSAVKVTVAKWITPNGKNLNKDGLTPDLEVKITEEDVKAEKDPQMEEAVKMITNN